MALAKSAFHEMSRVLKSRNVNMQTRKRILQCYIIWSTILYGCETWTLTKTMESKLEAFEIWVYRRMLRVSRTKHKTNEEVLKKANTKSSLLPTIKKRKCHVFGHVIRARSIQKLLLEGKGKRGRGRPRITWMKNIKEWLEHTYNGCVRRVEDRNSWRSMIADLLVDGTWWW